MRNELRGCLDFEGYSWQLQFDKGNGLADETGKLERAWNMII